MDEDMDSTQDSNEAGIEGVTLSLLAENGTEVATATTDSNGSYLFEEIPAGTYTVVITDTADELDGLVGTEDPDSSEERREGTECKNRWSPNHHEKTGFTPAREPDIGGTLYLDEDMDRKQDSHEAGIAGVTLSLLAEMGTGEPTLTPDNHGTSTNT